jgi:hypothetical protein
MDLLHQKALVNRCDPIYLPVYAKVRVSRATDFLLTSYISPWIVDRCHETEQNGDCSVAESYCNTHVTSLFDKAGKSYYDVRAITNVPPGYASLLNSTATKGQIGAIGAYQECSDKVVSGHIYA